MSAKSKECLVTGLIIFGVIGLLWTQTLKWPGDSRVVPQGILVLMVALNAINTAFDIRKYAKDYEAKRNFTKETILLPLFIFAVIAAYIALFSLLGYLPATAAMIAGLLIYAKVRPVWLIVVIVAAYLLFTYGLFDLLLSVSVI